MGVLRTLAGKVLDDVGHMVRYETELAKAEMGEKARSLAIGAAMLIVAAVLAFVLLGALTATLIIVFALFLPAWAAALVVTGVLGLTVASLLTIGVMALKKGMPPTPQQAISTTKENIKWVRARLRSARD
ncbi:MAG: phage holin family protein [Gaiellaceae bacterium]